MNDRELFVNKCQHKATMNANNWVEFHKLFGQYLGYPKCCIDYFCAFTNTNIPVAVVCNMLYGKPIRDEIYVLCPKCRRGKELKHIKYYKQNKVYPIYNSFNEYKEKYLNNKEN